MALVVGAMAVTLGATSVLAAAPSSVTLGTSSGSLGTFFTGPTGNTLYTLSSDPNNSSTCSGACATAWPPLLIAPGGTITGPTGVSGTWGMFNRSDGTTQVTFNGRPLYYFVHDTAAGQTNGEGIVAFGGTWHVALTSLAASSASPSASASASPTSSVAGVTSAPSASTLPATSTEPPAGGSGPSATTLILLLLIGVLAVAFTVGALRTRMPRH